MKASGRSPTTRGSRPGCSSRRKYARLVPSLVRVAAIQATPVILDAEACVAKAERLLEEAAGRGVQLAVFPRPSSPCTPRTRGRRASAFGGWDEFWERLWESSVDVPGPLVDRLVEACRRHGVHCAIGVNERESERPGSSTTRCSLLGPDGLLRRHRKLMPTMHERLFHGIGARRRPAVVETPVGRIGGLICWENRMPLARYAVYRGGPQIWVAPTADDTDGWLAACATSPSSRARSWSRCRSSSPRRPSRPTSRAASGGQGGVRPGRSGDHRARLGRRDRRAAVRREGIVVADCDLRAACTRSAGSMRSATTAGKTCSAGRRRAGARRGAGRPRLTARTADQPGEDAAPAWSQADDRTRSRRSPKTAPKTPAPGRPAGARGRSSTAPRRAARKTSPNPSITARRWRPGTAEEPRGPRRGGVLRRRADLLADHEDRVADRHHEHAQLDQRAGRDRGDEGSQGGAGEDDQHEPGRAGRPGELAGRSAAGRLTSTSARGQGTALDQRRHRQWPAAARSRPPGRRASARTTASAPAPPPRPRPRTGRSRPRRDAGEARGSGRGGPARPRPAPAPRTGPGTRGRRARSQRSPGPETRMGE